VALTRATHDFQQQRSIYLLLYEIVLRALLDGFSCQVLVMLVVKHDNRGCTRGVPDMAHGFNTRAIRQREIKKDEIEFFLHEIGYASC
jgi:hypothetical protein